KLLLYPNGDKSKNVKEHISMYLVFAETDSLPPDSGGKVRRFHGIKTTWGISHLISIAKFSDPSYGYLVIDICEFGVELFVLENTHGSECLTLKEGATLTHTWKIKQFSQIQKNYCYSSIFDTADGSKWKIQINPKGGGEEKNKSLSLYLSLADSETSAPGGKVYTEFILRIRNQRQDKHKELRGKSLNHSTVSHCENIMKRLVKCFSELKCYQLL
ncbi:hypothetical protein GIB67_027171, partial [Kingdonia uniflora]